MQGLPFRHARIQRARAMVRVFVAILLQLAREDALAPFGARRHCPVAKLARFFAHTARQKPLDLECDAAPRCQLVVLGFF
jgi:hypothetical protein